MSERGHIPQKDSLFTAKTDLLDRIKKHIERMQPYNNFTFPDPFPEIITNVVIDMRRLGTKQELLQKTLDEQERKKYESKYNRALEETNYKVRKYMMDEIKREIGINLLTNLLQKRLEGSVDNVPIANRKKILRSSATIFSSVLLSRPQTVIIKPLKKFL